MIVAEAAERLGGTLVAAAQRASNRVQGGYASDLLSDVIANAHEGDLWVTLQRHVNIVAVAQLKDLAGIVLVNGRQPGAEVIARAEEQQIPIVVSPLPTFEIVGLLYQMGVRARR